MPALFLPLFTRHHYFLTLLVLLGGLLRSPTVWAQVSAAKPKEPLPKLTSGRLHLANGSTVNAKIGLIDCDQLRGIGPDGALLAYTPDEVSSFVMGADSFTVLRNFYVVLNVDAEHYKSSFMRVCAAGAGLELYEFHGIMARTQLDGSGAAMAGASIALSVAVGAPILMAGGFRNEENAVMTTAWLLRRDGNPRWLTLPTGARNLREIIEPLVADDSDLASSVRWGTLRRQDVPALLSLYVERKSTK